MGLYRALIVLLIGIACSSCATKAILGTAKNPIDIVIDKTYQANIKKHIGVFESKITNDVLMLRFGNRKSCGDEDIYSITTKLQINKSNPPQMIFYLENKNELDSCNNDSTQVLHFDLFPLKEHYKQIKFVSDKVVLNLNGKNCGIYSLENL